MRKTTVLILTIAFGAVGWSNAEETTDSSRSILGAWSARSFHASFGSLYQPNGGTRKRNATIHLRREGDRIVGYAEVLRHQRIDGQGSWDGKTEFSTVRVTGDDLLIEFASSLDGAHTTTRIQAKVESGRLVGTWRILDGSGSESYRGKWLALRPSPVD